MLAQLRASVTYANVMATVAVFVALGGTSYAVATGSIDSREIKDNSVAGRDVRNRSLTGTDVRNNRLTGADIRNDRLTGADVLESSLGKVPSAGAADTANTANSATSAGNADKLDNLDSGDFLPADSEGIALAGANVTSGGTLRAWFNRFGGQPTVDKTGTGAYVLTFPGLEGQLPNTEVVHMATLSDVGEIDVGSSGGNPRVTTRNSAGGLSDRAFYYTAFGTNVAP